jgi:hypothetical protein
MKTKDLECSTCKKKFKKPMNEYRRRVKMGKTNFYCSLSCGKKTSENLSMLKEVSKPHWFSGGENKLITNEQLLKSSMKEFMRRIRQRKDKFFEELDIEKLLDIWNYQNGKCKYTNVKLVLPRDNDYKKVSNNYKASIDRIDGNKPYTIDNIQFVSVTVNFLRNKMSETETLEFFRITKSMKID